MTLAFSEAPEGLGWRTVRDSLFAVTGGRVTEARRASPPSNLRFVLTLEPEGNAAVRLALATLPACGREGSVCTADGRSLRGPLGLTVPGPAALSVADAAVKEGPGAELAFAVTLDRARHAAVTVDYATSDGTATAGEDYTAASGTLSFRAGETAKTVRVRVLDDAHDEGTETMTLRLSNPRGARIADGEATGTIENSDPARGLSVDLRARGLVSHEAKGFREAGLSGALAWDGRPGSARGPSLTLSQSVGGPAEGGMDGLFQGNALPGLAANDDAAEDGPLAAHRFEATFGYGLPAWGDRFTVTPEAGFGLSDTGRDYRLGWRLTRESRSGDTGSLELRLDATRREAANPGSGSGAGYGAGEPEHTVGFEFKATW